MKTEQPPVTSGFTAEEFYQTVTACECYRKWYWQAHISFKGKDYMGDGNSEQEAKDNLWEYLSSDLGITSPSPNRI